jgi:hypothetical protein
MIGHNSPDRIRNRLLILRQICLILAEDVQVDILKTSTKMTDEQFQSLKFLEEAFVQTAVTAKQIGITHEIQQAIVPAGAELFNVEF